MLAVLNSDTLIIQPSLQNNGQKDRITCDCGMNVYQNLPIAINPSLQEMLIYSRYNGGCAVLSKKANKKGEKAMKRSEKMNQQI